MSEVKLKISAQESASKVLADVRESMTRLEEVSTKVGSALGLIGVAGIGGLVATVRAAVDGVDAFNDLSDATGASIENISALDDVAARTGTSFGTVETALIKFNSVLKDAKPGSDAEAALNALGLSVQDLKNLDPAEALLKTSKALAGFADDSNKARLVQELFGKSLKEVSPFLKDLAEQGALVAKVTTEQAAEAEKFNKQLFELQTNAAQAGRAISVDLVTALNASIKEFDAGRKAAGGWLDAILLIGTTSPFKSVSENIREYSDQLADLEAQKKSMGGLELKVRGEAFDKEIQKAKTRLAYFREIQALAVDTANVENEAERRRLGLSTAPKSVGDFGGGSGSGSRGAAAAAAAAKREREAARRAELEWQREIDRDMEKSFAARAKWEAEEARIAEAEAKRTADYLLSLQEELDAIAKGNEAQARQIEEIGLTTDQLSALKLARMDETIAQKEATLATAAANGLSYEEISAIEQKIELLKKQRELTAQSQVAQAAADSKADAEAASKEFADTMRNDLKGAFSAAFRDSSGDPLKAFGDALENMVFTRAATALSEAAMEGLGSIIGSLGGSSGAGIGDLIGNLLSFDGGGSTGSGPRSGGLDGKGGFLSILHPNETVLDHTKGQTGTGGGISIVQNINVDSRSDVATIRAAMQQAKQETLAAIQQSRRAGGAYA